MKSKSMQKENILHGFSTGAIRGEDIRDGYAALPLRFPIFQKPVSFARDFAWHPQQSEAAEEVDCVEADARSKTNARCFTKQNACVDV